MADYYSQATVVPSLKLSAEEMKFLHWLQHDLSDTVSDIPQEYLLACKDMGIIRGGEIGEFDFYGIDYEEDGDAWYFFSPEYYPDGATDFFQWYLRKHLEVPFIRVEMAYTCSKMRADGFGGGALHITTNKVEFFSTHDWLEKRVGMYERGVAGSDNTITSYIHCKKCMDEMPGDVNPQEWERLDVGFTDRGIQVWCFRHNCNVIHIDMDVPKSECEA